MRERQATMVKKLPAKMLAAAVLTALLLSGCGSQEDAGTGESIEAKADAEEGFLVQNPEWESIINGQRWELEQRGWSENNGDDGEEDDDWEDDE